MVSEIGLSPFSRLIGQRTAVELLTQAVAKQQIAPAYLFVGPEGVGRTLAAQCFLQLLLSQSGHHRGTRSGRITQGNHPDLLWVEPTYLHQGKRLSVAEAIAQGLKRKAPPQIRLEQIREITQFLSRPPLEALRSVVVIDQAETMAEAAANGLLKTLEEPGQATLILIAPSVDAILPTLVSRCQRIPFYRLEPDALVQVLQTLGHLEVLEYPEVLSLAHGSPGAAIAHHAQLQAIPDEIRQAVRQLPYSVRQALDLARQIDKSLDTEAQLWLVDYWQQGYWQQQVQQPGRPHTQVLQTLEKTRQALLSYVQPRLVWEVTLLTLVQGLTQG